MRSLKSNCSVACRGVAAQNSGFAQDVQAVRMPYSRLANKIRRITKAAAMKRMPSILLPTCSRSRAARIVSTSASFSSAHLGHLGAFSGLNCSPHRLQGLFFICSNKWAARPPSPPGLMAHLTDVGSISMKTWRPRKIGCASPRACAIGMSPPKCICTQWRARQFRIVRLLPQVHDARVPWAESR